MLQSLTPEAQQEWKKILARMSDDPEIAKAQGFGKPLGYTIQKREIVSDDEVVLHITMTGSDQVQKYDTRKIGSEWKLNGPPRYQAPKEQVQE